jgi:hypothetical protein
LNESLKFEFESGFEYVCRGRALIGIPYSNLLPSFFIIRPELIAFSTLQLLCLKIAFGNWIESIFSFSGTSTNLFLRQNFLNSIFLHSSKKGYSEQNRGS